MFQAGLRIFAISLAATFFNIAAAGTFPERAIKVVTPFPAGGAHGGYIAASESRRDGQAVGY